jgi:hypothetical protein
MKRHVHEHPELTLLLIREGKVFRTDRLIQGNIESNPKVMAMFSI